MRIINKILLFAAVSATLLCQGCANATAEETAVKFCDAMHNFDIAAMAELADTENGDFSEFEANLGEDSEYSGLFSLFKKIAGEISYEIVNVTESSDKNSATVTVRFEYADISGVVKDAFSQYLSEAIYSSMAGEEVSVDRFYELVLEEYEAQSHDSTSETGALGLVKEENGWKITRISDEIYNVISGNFIEALQDYTN